MRLALGQRALGIAALAIAAGPVVLAIGFAPFDQRVGWLTVLSGWIVTASGLIAWLRNPFQRAGPLLVLSAAGSFTSIVLGAVDGVPAGVVTFAATLPWLVLGHAVVAAASRTPNPFGDRGVLAAYVLLAGSAVVVENWLAAVLNLLPDPRVVARVAESTLALGVCGLVLAEVGRRRRIVDLILDLDPATEGVEVERRLAQLAGGPAAGDHRIQRSVASALASIAERRRLEEDVARELRELSASRRRIVEAADAETRQLRIDLERRVGWRLRELETRLRVLTTASGATLSATALEHLVGAQREIEALLHGLPPGDLGRIGLVDAIAAMAARSPVPVRFSARGEAPVEEAARSALYFTCSEGLSNVIRHAGATMVDVELATDTRTCRLTISDDGVGGIEIGDGAGTGLRGVSDRLETVGGRLEIRSPIGGGTMLVATIPAS